MKKGAGFFTISMKIDLFFSVHFHSSNGKIRGGVVVVATPWLECVYCAEHLRFVAGLRTPLFVLYLSTKRQMCTWRKTGSEGKVRRGKELTTRMELLQQGVLDDCIDYGTQLDFLSMSL